MIDIRFYIETAELKSRLRQGEAIPEAEVRSLLEQARSRHPVVYSIETTNACNMTCGFCPRTELMTRRVENLEMSVFERVASQLRPWSDEEWQRWTTFAEEHYGVPRDGMSENHFFLYVIAKVIVLHGYGDPLLDKRLGERIERLAERGIPTYFSCNPSNIDVVGSLELFERGLDYVKYSVDSVHDLTHRQLRGQRSNYTDAFTRIQTMHDAIQKKGYPTQIVITMIDLGREGQQEEYEELVAAFADMDVYIYLKSLDNQWLGDSDQETGSIHWQEFCQFPWSSLTLMADGSVVPCMQDYDCEMKLGDPGLETLEAIWNSPRYEAFRRAHFEGAHHLKCANRCDMKLVSDSISPRADSAGPRPSASRAGGGV